MRNLTDNPLDMLTGRELSSVEFVRDYIQLRFDGPSLTVLTDPVLETADEEYTRTHFGFCDMLCNFIGDPVQETSLNSEQLVLRFGANRKLKISLKPGDRIAKEAVIFYGINGEKWWVW